MNEKVNEKVGTCGCGRSPTGDCIGWHALSQEEFEKKQHQIYILRFSLSKNRQMFCTFVEEL